MPWAWKLRMLEPRAMFHTYYGLLTNDMSAALDFILPVS
jgi:hypothetical protein